MIVLDSHALVWWTHAPEKLSEPAREACGRIPDEGGGVSSISLWELGLKAKLGQIDLGLPVREYAQRLERLAQFEIIPVTADLWLRNLELDWDHRDPADRTIVATAQSRRARLITRDTIIRDRFPDLVLW